MNDFGVSEIAKGVESDFSQLVHLTNPKGNDLESVASSKQNVVVCPRANATLNVGVAPLARMLDMGIRPLLGTDNVMLNSPNMLRELEFTLKMMSVYNAFSSEEVSTTIPYTIKGWSNAGNNNGQKFSSEILASGTTLTFLGQSSGSVASQTRLSIFANGETLDHKVDRGFTVEIASEDWGKALGGDYATTIIFSAEVVVE